LGCTTDSTELRFAKTEYETRRCPRRHLIDSPEIAQVLELYRSCDGKPGLDAHEKFSPHFFQAFSVIEAGKAKRFEAEQLRQTAENKTREFGRKK
jgi:hypothetical protein